MLKFCIDFLAAFALLYSVYLMGYLLALNGGDEMADKFDLAGKLGTDRRIMRTIYFTRVYGHQLDAAGDAHPFEDVLIGEYRPARASKFYARTMPDERITVTRCEVMSQLVSMSFYDFWLNGEASEDPKQVHKYVLDKEIF